MNYCHRLHPCSPILHPWYGDTYVPGGQVDQETILLWLHGALLLLWQRRVPAILQKKKKTQLGISLYLALPIPFYTSLPTLGLTSGACPANIKLSTLISSASYCVVGSHLRLDHHIVSVANCRPLPFIICPLSALGQFDLSPPFDNFFFLQTKRNNQPFRLYILPGTLALLGPFS